MRNAQLRKSFNVLKPDIIEKVYKKTNYHNFCLNDCPLKSKDYIEVREKPQNDSPVCVSPKSHDSQVYTEYALPESWQLTPRCKHHPGVVFGFVRDDLNKIKKNSKDQKT